MFPSAESMDQEGCSKGSWDLSSRRAARKGSLMGCGGKLRHNVRSLRPGHGSLPGRARSKQMWFGRSSLGNPGATPAEVLAPRRLSVLGSGGAEPEPRCRGGFPAPCPAPAAAPRCADRAARCLCSLGFCPEHKQPRGPPGPGRLLAPGPRQVGRERRPRCGKSSCLLPVHPSETAGIRSPAQVGSSAQLQHPVEARPAPVARGRAGASREITFPPGMSPPGPAEPRAGSWPRSWRIYGPVRVLACPANSSSLNSGYLPAVGSASGSASLLLAQAASSQPGAGPSAESPGENRASRPAPCAISPCPALTLAGSGFSPSRGSVHPRVALQRRPGARDRTRPVTAPGWGRPPGRRGCPHRQDRLPSGSGTRRGARARV